MIGEPVVLLRELLDEQLVVLFVLTRGDETNIDELRLSRS